MPQRNIIKTAFHQKKSSLSTLVSWGLLEIVWQKCPCIIHGKWQRHWKGTDNQQGKWHTPTAEAYRCWIASCFIFKHHKNLKVKHFFLFPYVQNNPTIYHASWYLKWSLSKIHTNTWYILVLRNNWERWEIKRPNINEMLYFISLMQDWRLLITTLLFWIMVNIDCSNPAFDSCSSNVTENSFCTLQSQLPYLLSFTHLLREF